MPPKTVDDQMNSVDTDGEYLKINKKDIQPLYKMQHEHQYVKDETDETEEYYAIKCIVHGCPHGRLVAKSPPADSAQSSRAGR